MVSYEGDVFFVNNEEEYLVVDADDIDDAELKMTETIKERYPDARSIIVENLKEVVRQ